MRRVFAILVAFLLGFAGMTLTATAASADTALCNSTFGAYCGKIQSTSGSEARLFIIDSYGRGHWLYPGQNARNLGIRDVAAFQTTSNMKVSVRHGETRYTIGPNTRHNLYDSNLTRYVTVDMRYIY